MTNKTVRPIMTVEARDAIDAMHSNFECETRSESIIEFVHSSARAARSAIKLRSEVRQWKLIAWSMTAACIALVATMTITAS